LGIRLANTYAGLQDGDVFEDVEVAFPAANEFDFAVKKKIQLARKTVFRSAGPLGDGFDQALGIRAPVNDEAGFGQGETTNEVGACFFQG